MVTRVVLFVLCVSTKCLLIAAGKLKGKLKKDMFQAFGLSE